MPGRQYFVYILTNNTDGVLYTGVTNDLKRRVWEHREHFVKGFTEKYNVQKLVYYEVTENVISAISREKQIKSWSRARKIKLVEGFNPSWSELYFDL